MTIYLNLWLEHTPVLPRVPEHWSQKRKGAVSSTNLKRDKQQECDSVRNLYFGLLSKQNNLTTIFMQTSAVQVKWSALNSAIICFSSRKWHKLRLQVTQGLSVCRKNTNGNENEKEKCSGTHTSKDSHSETKYLETRQFRLLLVCLNRLCFIK